VPGTLCCAMCDAVTVGAMLQSLHIATINGRAWCSMWHDWCTPGGGKRLSFLKSYTRFLLLLAGRYERCRQISRLGLEHLCVDA
jgi:hypothetical protein